MSCRKTLVAVGGAALLAATIAPLSGAVAANPPGNNGTIKIDDVVFDDHPNNEPHVGCNFEVDWYGFDEGDYYSDVTFEMQPPSGTGILYQDSVFIGGDDSTGGGSEPGLDASREYNLNGPALAQFVEHPKQGYHIKLTVNTDGSQGADVKHKVFWVTGCKVTPS